MSAVFQAILNLRDAFAAVNLKQPAMIQLESFEEGLRFLAQMPSGVVSAIENSARQDDGWIEFQVFGINARFPTHDKGRARLSLLGKEAVDELMNNGGYRGLDGGIDEGSIYEFANDIQRAFTQENRISRRSVLWSQK